MTILNVNDIRWYKINFFVGKNIKLLRGKMLRTFQILNSCKLFPYVSIKKCRDKEMSKYNINPSRATNHTYKY